MKICALTILLLVVLAGVTLARSTGDSLCGKKACPKNTFCRVTLKCESSGKCTYGAQCLDSCPVRLCKKHCKDGFQKDSRGCPICKCKPKRKNSKPKH